ncbi:hypothetical protein [Reyranella soli]|uniref:Uncharacterized protein n=1 Tax=Reyranella soli TaxID=1230389 RepID=A0A512NKN1_9HYPH|nr:hypothetical protein [Reyranella soli]GEP59504.1 hypothetical protein RSO01_66700 [Reyranella soli]
MISYEAKEHVQSAFEDVLKTLDAMEREPDQAEELNLVDALCSMANGHLGCQKDWRNPRIGRKQSDWHRR